MDLLSQMGAIGAVGAGTSSAYYPEKPVRMPTLQERLDLAVKGAEERLAAVKEARDIFERNPDIERLLDLMQRSYF